MNAESAEEENKSKQGCPELPHFERNQRNDFENVARFSTNCEYKKRAETGENLRHSLFKAVLNRLYEAKLNILCKNIEYKSYQKYKVDEKETAQNQINKFCAHRATVFKFFPSNQILSIK